MHCFFESRYGTDRRTNRRTAPSLNASEFGGWHKNGSEAHFTHRQIHNIKKTNSNITNRWEIWSSKFFVTNLSSRARSRRREEVKATQRLPSRRLGPSCQSMLRTRSTAGRRSHGLYSKQTQSLVTSALETQVSRTDRSIKRTQRHNRCTGETSKSLQYVMSTARPASNDGQITVLLCVLDKLTYLKKLWLKILKVIFNLFSRSLVS